MTPALLVGRLYTHLCVCLFPWSCVTLLVCTNIGCHKPKHGDQGKENSTWEQDLAECVSKIRSRLCSPVAVEYKFSISFALHLSLGAASQLVTKTQQNAAQKAEDPVHLDP